MDISGTESGAQEGSSKMPVGPEPYNSSGQQMPVDGGPGSSPTPAPGDVASPGADEYTMVPNVSGTTFNIGGNSTASMPTPDN